MEQVECIVIGAGVVGLAIARALALDGREVIVLEAEDAIGTQTSARNSEVIHAGIYYPPGSLMAMLCVAGRHTLYDYLGARGLPHQRCGKLIVATTDEEAGRLESIRQHALANGVDDLRLIGAGEACRMEPQLACTAALVSPSTGILDTHAYMLSLQGEAEAMGVMFAFNTPFVSAQVTTGGFEVATGGEAPMRLACKVLVNAAGHGAPGAARAIAGLDPAHVPTGTFAKGSYFTLAGRAPFSRLIYPVPVAGALGVHLTLDLGGQARFGPDIEWVETMDYAVDPERSAGFYQAIRRYWPGLPDEALQPGYSGIRPKIVPPEVAKQDFRIDGPRDHGVGGLVNLFGIESPGLTASLAIAQYVKNKLEETDVGQG